MRFEFVHVDDVGDHRRHQGEQSAEAECHERRRKQDKPGCIRVRACPGRGGVPTNTFTQQAEQGRRHRGIEGRNVVRVVTDPFQRITHHRDAGRDEEGPPFANLRAEPGNEADHDQRRDCAQQAGVTDPGRPDLGIAAEHVIDQYVGLESGNKDEAVKDKKRCGAEFQERLELQCNYEAAQELDDIAHDDAASRPSFRGSFLRLLLGDVLEPLAQEDRRQDADDNDEYSNNDGEARRALDFAFEPGLVVHDGQEIRRDHVGNLADEVLHAHEPRALVVIGRQLIAERNPGRREHRVGKIEEKRADQEIPEIKRLLLACR